MHPLPAGKVLTVLCTLCFLLFFSCGATETTITSVYPRVIFAYESEDSQPEVFLSVYGEVSGEPWRLDHMSITHTATGLIWTTSGLEILQGAGEHAIYAGYGTFKPYEDTFPAGSYVITWYEKSGRHFTVDFHLQAQSPDLPQKPETVFNVMVEDQDHRILYAGHRTNDFISADLVLARYPEAELYRKYVLKSNTRVMYVYPPVYVRNKSDNDE